MEVFYFVNAAALPCRMRESRHKPIASSGIFWNNGAT